MAAAEAADSKVNGTAQPVVETGGNNVSAPPINDATTAALASYAQRAEKAERELAARLAAETAAAEAHKKDLEASGKHAELLAIRTKELEDLKAAYAAVQPDAGYGKAWRESETKRIERATETMDENAKRVLDGIEGLPAKSAFVAFYEQTQARGANADASSSPSLPTRKPPPSAAPAPATHSVDLVAMIESKQITVAEARRKYPTEYLAQVESQVTSKKTSKFGFFGM